MDKTFVLGTGAVKGGTTWLHEYLLSFDAYHKGVMKEIRVWETATQPEFGEFEVKLFDVKDRGDLFRWTFRTFPAAYFRFYNRIYRRHRVRLTGDLTPTYTGLSADTFRRIRDGFARRGVKVKAVFLMRDPVERCWSQQRMVERMGRPERYIRIDGDTESNLLAYHTTAHCHLLTDYHRTLANLEAAFAPEDIHFGFYETMFEADEIARLSRFLGLAPKPELVENRFNTSDKTSEISDAAKARIAEEYRPVYEDCAARFPVTREIWGGWKHLDASAS